MKKSAPPRESNEEIRSAAEEAFIQELCRLIGIVRIHRENNRLVLQCAETFIRSIFALVAEEDYVTIQFVRGRVFLQNQKVAYRRDYEILMKKLSAFFSERSIGGLRFHTSISDAPIQALLTFARLLNEAGKEKNPLGPSARKLTDAGIAWVEILHEPHSREDDRESESTDAAMIARKTYAQVLASVQEVAQKVRAQERAGIGKTLRMAQNMVDLMMTDESMFKALSTIRIYDDYTYSHSVNVAILSMCLGKHIGLSKNSLERLGLCGLLHDIGKVEVPEEILNKPGKLNRDEREEMKKHALNSVRLIVKIKASRDRKARLLLPPFEHHLKFDLTGYPQTPRKKPVSLFGRILSIADVYDAITSPRVYRPSILSPDRALGMMLKGAGKDFDPILIKVFINMLGVYPIGTLLELDTQELALVKDTQQAADRPKVILLIPDGKGGFDTGEQVNLDDRDPTTGTYLRKVIQSYHPSAFNIQPSEFIF